MGIFLLDTTSSPGLSLKKWVGRSKNSILIIPFLKGKTFACTQGENCNKSGLFLWGPWDGIVSAAPAQANSLRSRRLEVVGTRKNGRARKRHSFVRARSLLLKRGTYPSVFPTSSPNDVFYTFCDASNEGVNPRRKS